MDGLFFLSSIVAIGVVMWWVWQNDRVPPDRPTRGLFAMRLGAEMARRRRLQGWVSAHAAETPERRRRRHP